ncbi:hypothetical protein BCR34DRAFT_588010 [Clohesyomyces aquaticus]|uniref:Uncharacterized protein n=1 Tax=Clohesyomyces aquaticus TaxID=1231657 RepID=A0A1Y1ZM82_9PLEO|nr:hypothetical protein BCR34DRAFT_588010 [Clohesyomyces aquaticus]
MHGPMNRRGKAKELNIQQSKSMLPLERRQIIGHVGTSILASRPLPDNHHIQAKNLLVEILLCWKQSSDVADATGDERGSRNTEIKIHTKFTYAAVRSTQFPPTKPQYGSVMVEAPSIVASFTRSAGYPHHAKPKRILAQAMLPLKRKKTSLLRTMSGESGSRNTEVKPISGDTQAALLSTSRTLPTKTARINRQVGTLEVLSLLLLPPTAGYTPHTKPKRFPEYTDVGLEHKLRDGLSIGFKLECWNKTGYPTQ